MDIRNIEPKEVFKWFYELNQHPRSSGKEKEVSDFLVNFAKERNLEVYQDEILNVIIKKPGTPGYENSETVIIQGHMDMVCVKGSDSDHNFDTDPIEMIVDGDILRANNTTLGGDDGIAVAYGLAILDSKDIPHPPIELLITTNEETGMDGAIALKGDHLTGTRLINIDNEEEGVLLVSCSGGANVDTFFNVEREANNSPAIEIKISGLKGGHSGSEIDRQRGNAIKILSRLLVDVSSDIKIASIKGGLKHNSVPNYIDCVVASDNLDKVKKNIEEIFDLIKAEYAVEDPSLKLDVVDASASEVYTSKLSCDLIEYLYLLPDGVQYISKDIEGLVQTSLNNAIISEEDGKIRLVTSVRSCIKSSQDEIVGRILVLAKRFGADTKIYATYPAWQFEKESKIRDIAVETYKKMYGKEPVISSIHAGLECGILKGILPDADMISIGPDIFDAHTEKEHLYISSVQRVWEYTLEILKNLK